MNKFAYVFVWLLLQGLNAHAQTSILEKYIQEGLENNQALQQETFALEKNLSALREAKGLFAPSVSFQASYTRAGGGRLIQIPVGDLLNPVYATLNQLTDSDNFPQIANVNEQFLPNDFHETKLRVIQPLFNPDIYYNYQIKQEMVLAQEQKKEAYQKELIKEIKVAYYQYLQASEAIEIYEQTEVLLQEILRVNQKLVANHKATKEVIYGAEYEISKLKKQLAEADKNERIAQAYFNFLLNRSLDETIDAYWKAGDNSPTLDLVKAAEIQESEAIAVQNRHEIKQVQYGLQAQRLALNLQKASSLPRVNLVGDFGYQGFGYTFNNEQDFWLVQASLSWDLFKGFQSKERIQQAKLEQHMLESQLEDLRANVQLQVKQAQYEWLAAREGKQAAADALKQVDAQYNIAKRKYDEGMLSFYELLQVRNNLTEASISLSLAKYELLIQEAKVDWVVGKG